MNWRNKQFPEGDATPTDRSVPCLPSKSSSDLLNNFTCRSFNGVVAQRRKFGREIDFPSGGGGVTLSYGDLPATHRQRLPGKRVGGWPEARGRERQTAEEGADRVDLPVPDLEGLEGHQGIAF